MITEREDYHLECVRNAFKGLDARNEYTQHLMFNYFKHELKVPHNKAHSYTRRLINEAIRDHK